MLRKKTFVETFIQDATSESELCGYRAEAELLVTCVKIEQTEAESGKKACQWSGDLVESRTASSPGGIQVPHELPGRGLRGSA